MNEPHTGFASPQPSRLKRWMREPLLHFLLIGVTLFAIYHWRNPSSSIGLATSRFAGLTLIALGVACWPCGSAPQALCGMLTYSLFATFGLLYLALSGKTGFSRWRCW